MSIETNEDLLTEQLQDMHSAAKQFDEAIGRMAGISPSKDISDLLAMRRDAIRQYREHIEELARTYEFSTEG